MIRGFRTNVLGGGANPRIKYLTKGNSIKTQSIGLSVGDDNVYFTYPEQPSLLDVDFTGYNTLKITNKNGAYNGELVPAIDSTDLSRGHIGTSISTDSWNISNRSGLHTITLKNSAASTINIYSIILEK